MKATLERVRALGLGCVGFYTEEVRDHSGDRLGFDIVCVDGRRGPLARKGMRGTMVGQYAVDEASIENLCVSSLRMSLETNGCLLVLDEVGKMELKCNKFFDAAQDAINATSLTLGTLPAPRYGRKIAEVEAVTARPDVSTVTVTKSNRDWLASEVCHFVIQALQGGCALDFKSIQVEAPENAAGPWGAVGSAVKTLLLGEFASPARTRYQDRLCWSILDPMLSVSNENATARRRALEANGICLWGVSSQVPPGRSKTKRIKIGSINDFDKFARSHPDLRTICFDGRGAAAAFAAAGPYGGENQILLADRKIRLVILPSSSPKNTTLSQKNKMAAWAHALLPPTHVASG